MSNKYLHPGTFVYFHAYAKPDDPAAYFLCGGYIARQPTKTSKVYKVIIIEINPKTVLGGSQVELAKTLLGKKIARYPNQILTSLTGWTAKLYTQEEKLEVKKQELNKIIHSLKDK